MNNLILVSKQVKESKETILYLIFLIKYNYQAQS